MHKVLVYGTLKQDGYNHALLKGCDLLEARVFEKVPFIMRSVGHGGFPALDFAGNGGELADIYGEIYEVPEVVLRDLDRLEGHPDWYKRIKYNFGNHVAWVYVRGDEWRERQPHLPVIESGNWMRGVA